MRVKPFYKKASTKGEQLKKDNPALAMSLAQMSDRDIVQMLKRFISPDVLSLLFEVNQDGLSAAINSIVFRSLSKNNISTWISELGEGEREDVMQEINASLYGAGGIISQLIERGSRSNDFQYAREGKTRSEMEYQSRQRSELKKNLKQVAPGIEAPHCPYCASLGIDHPLYSVNVDGASGKLNHNDGLDKAGRCTYEEEYDNTPSENKAIERGLRELESSSSTDESNPFADMLGEDYQNEESSQKLKCTFVINSGVSVGKSGRRGLPSLLNIIMAKAEGVASRIISEKRRDEGKTLSRENIKELNELQSIKNRTPKQERRLEKLLQRQHLKQKDQVSTTSIDKQVGEDGRSGHETIDSDHLSEMSEEERRLHQIDLDNSKKKLTEGYKMRDSSTGESFFVEGPISASELKTLLDINKTNPPTKDRASLFTIIDKIETISGTRGGNKDLEDEVAKSLRNIITRHNSLKNSSTYCSVCEIPVMEGVDTCPTRDKIMDTLSQAISSASSKDEFKNIINSQLNEKEMMHIKESGLPSLLSEFFPEEEESLGGFFDDDGQETKIPEGQIWALIKKLPKLDTLLGKTIVQEEVTEKATEDVFAKIKEVKDILDRVDDDEMTDLLKQVLRGSIES